MKYEVNDVVIVRYNFYRILLVWSIHEFCRNSYPQGSPSFEYPSMSTHSWCISSRTPFSRSLLQLSWPSISVRNRTVGSGWAIGTDRDLSTAIFRGKGGKSRAERDGDRHGEGVSKEHQGVGTIDVSFFGWITIWRFEFIEKGYLLKGFCEKCSWWRKKQKRRACDEVQGSVGW